MNLYPSLIAVKAERCKRSYYHFFKEFWSVIESEELIDNWHIKYLCDELQCVANRVFNREAKEYDLIINIAPGESKSSIVTVLFNAWCWTNDPSTRFISSSYSSSLSISHSVKTRDIITSDKYREYFPEVKLKGDQSGKSEYKNTEGGDRISTSTQGTITGKHAHFILIDDPINPKEAASETELKNANSYIDTTLNSRKVDKKVTVTILVMQRLHQNDPTGHLLSKDKRVKHICLPGEISDNVKPIELRDKYIDGLLDPVRLDEEVLKEQRVDLGSYGFSGQIMQTPSPEGGGIWQKWFNPIADKEMDKIVDSLQSYGSDWDLAYTKIDTNSASAFITSGTLNGNIYIDRFGYGFLEFPDLIKYMRTKASPHYIEAKASGKSAKQTLTSEGITAIEVDIRGGDKIARARMATPKAESGCIYVRESILDKLYNDDKQGILRFPNGSHADVADTLAQCIQRHDQPFFVW